MATTTTRDHPTEQASEQTLGQTSVPTSGPTSEQEPGPAGADGTVPELPVLPAWAGPESVTDRVLLDTAVALQVCMNRAHARRLEALCVFHDRRVADYQHTDPGARVLQATPLRETCAELSALLGCTELAVQIDLDTTTGLRRWFPGLWARCLTGRLDLGRALVCLDQTRHLASEDDIADYAALMEAWFDQHDPHPHNNDGDGGAGLCRLSRDRIQRAARWRRLKFPAATTRRPSPRRSRNAP